MRCWVQYPWVVFVFLGATLDSAETPFAKTPFSWFQINLHKIPVQRSIRDLTLHQIPVVVVVKTVVFQNGVFAHQSICVVDSELSLQFSCPSLPSTPAGLHSNATAGFPRPGTTPPTPIPEVIPWLALFHLGGILRS